MGFGGGSDPDYSGLAALIADMTSQKANDFFSSQPGMKSVSPGMGGDNALSFDAYVDNKKEDPFAALKSDAFSKIDAAKNIESTKSDIMKRIEAAKNLEQTKKGAFDIIGGAKKSADYVSQQDALIDQMLHGTSPEEEAIMASLDPGRAGLMSHFASGGGTGSGALQSQLLTHAAKGGEAVAKVRAGNRDKAFDMIEKMRTSGRADEATKMAEKYFGLKSKEYEEITKPTADITIETLRTNLENLQTDADWIKKLDLLANPNITPEEAGKITGDMMKTVGIDPSTIDSGTARETYTSHVVTTLGYSEQNGKYFDDAGVDVTDRVNTIVDNWGKSTLGLDVDYGPAVEVGGTKADYAADPFGEDTLAAAGKGNKDAISVMTDEIIAQGRYDVLKGMSISDPVYKSVLDRTDAGSFSSATTSNQWFDEKYYTSFGSEDADGNVVYQIGKTFKVGGNMYEVTGQREDNDKDEYVMIVKNLVTGETKNLSPSSATDWVSLGA
jgi:hypothetical protein